MENLAKPYLPDYASFPGMGILLTLVALTLIGIVVNAYLVSSIIKGLQTYIEKLPVIKTLYGAINDAVALFNASKEEKQKRAVMVETLNDVFLVGFITGEQATQVLFPDDDSRVAVYIPLSYQIGGYTIYVTRDKVKELDIDVETAMRIAVTGGNSIKKPGQ